MVMTEEIFNSIIQNERLMTILNKTAEMIIATNGTVSYETMEDFLFETWQPQFNDDRLVRLILLTAIAYHIPVYDAQQHCMFLRDPEKALSSVFTFYYTHKDELLIYEYFNTHQEIVAPLVFGDNTHDLFHAGTGSKTSDFIEANNPAATYEVKHNYFNVASPSSLHNACVLLNCINPNILNIHIIVDGIVEQTPVLTITDITFPERNTFINGLSPEDSYILRSGNCLVILDMILKQQFNWDWPE